MNTYYLVKSPDPWFLTELENAYVNEGYTVYLRDTDILLLVKHSVPVDTDTEKIMLQVICSSLRRLPGSFTVDLSDLVNRHIQRLTENGCQSLKFHDPFTDELKQLNVQLIALGDL